jgi:hypothetical protein
MAVVIPTLTQELKFVSSSSLFIISLIVLTLVTASLHQGPSARASADAQSAAANAAPDPKVSRI